MRGDYGLNRMGMYALPGDLAQSLHTTPGYIRWCASRYAWRKVRIGRTMRYHVEDAYRDLGEGVEGRRQKLMRRHTAADEGA